MREEHGEPPAAGPAAVSYLKRDVSDMAIPPGPADLSKQQEGELTRGRLAELVAEEHKRNAILEAEVEELTKRLVEAERQARASYAQAFALLERKRRKRRFKRRASG